MGNVLKVSKSVRKIAYFWFHSTEELEKEMAAVESVVKCKVIGAELMDGCSFSYVMYCDLAFLNVSDIWFLTMARPCPKRHKSSVKFIIIFYLEKNKNKTYAR